MPSFAPPQLRDGDVALRPWRTADAAVAVIEARDPDVLRWTMMREDLTEERMVVWIAENEALMIRGEGANFVISDASSGRFIGSAGLAHFDWKERRAEVYYWVARGQRGRGVARRAVGLLTRWGFEELGLRRIELLTFPGNAASQAVAHAAGYVRDRGRTKRREIKGRVVDLLCFVRDSP